MSESVAASVAVMDNDVTRELLDGAKENPFAVLRIVTNANDRDSFMVQISFYRGDVGLIFLCFVIYGK